MVIHVAKGVFFDENPFSFCFTDLMAFIVQCKVRML